MEFQEVSLAGKEDTYVLLNWTDMTQVRQKNLNKIIKSFELNKNGRYDKQKAKIPNIFFVTTTTSLDIYIASLLILFLVSYLTLISSAYKLARF